MDKLTTALGAMAIATPTLADIPNTPECQPLNDMVSAFSERYEQGILPMDISPQIERFYGLAQDEVDGLEPNPEEAFRTGQELGLKFQAMGLQRFQMQFILEQIKGAVGQCVESTNGA